MGVVHKPNPDWASHVPVLIKALELTNTGMGDENPVLELGMGMFSTPLLYTLCQQQNRLLVSLDSDEQFYNMFSRFKGDRYARQLVEDWDTDPMITIEPWTVVLIDQKPAEQRKESAIEFIDADYLILHDSEDPLYGYDEIYPLFKYRYDYKEFKTWTTVLSNKHELHQFHNTLG